MVNENKKMHLKSKKELCILDDAELIKDCKKSFLLTNLLHCSLNQSFYASINRHVTKDAQTSNRPLLANLSSQKIQKKSFNRFVEKQGETQQKV